MNALPLYRQEKEFGRYGIMISRQDMVYWMIQCADRYLAILYDYLHKKLYYYHALQADEALVLVNKDGRGPGAGVICGFSAPERCTAADRSSCTNTRRPVMPAAYGSS